MTYIVNEACIKCKYMDCVEVCPVDCFYEQPVRRPLSALVSLWHLRPHLP